MINGRHLDESITGRCGRSSTDLHTWIKQTPDPLMAGGSQARAKVHFTFYVNFFFYKNI